MSNKRIYDLSKELEKTNKEVIEIARKIGIQVKSHASSITDEQADKIRGATTSTGVNGRGALSSPEKDTDQEEVIVVRTETKEEEVVERRKGRSIVLRKRKKKVEPIEEIVEEKAEEVKAAQSEVSAEEPSMKISEQGAPAEPPKDVSETAHADRIKAEAEKGENVAEQGKAAPDITEESAPEESKEESTVKRVEEKAKPVPIEAEGKQETKKRKKKAGNVKPKREEIIDEDTLEQLRRAFKTNLPVRRREFLVTDKKVRPRASKIASDSKRRAAAALTQSEEGASAQVLEFPTKQAKKTIKIAESVNVGDLAKKMSVKLTYMIKKLMVLGISSTVNQSIDFETATIVAGEFGFEVEADYFEEKEILEAQNEGIVEEKSPRPPVVTVMGHVDHGKTTLLDTIRKTNVVAKEAGGITQHIGAYAVDVGEKKVVFIDTPGHKAFTAMRARGAYVTDLVILVVAADDGVMPQTVEAVNHSKAAGVPIVVAINKIDKTEANKDALIRQLSELGLVSEEWGGDTMFCEVSAKNNIGVDELLESVLLQAEVMELSANPNKMAMGTVIEAHLDKGRGPVATIIVKEGTLRVGNYILAGLTYGRTRAILDDEGGTIKEAGPSMPVEVLGLSSVPMAGDEFFVVKDEKTAKEIVRHRELKERGKLAASIKKLTLDTLFSSLEEGEVKELNLVIKADTQGSIEALKETIAGIESEKCKVSIIHSGVGAINETDIALASASNAVAVGFNIRPEPKALKAADRENVSLELHSIIYEVVDRIKKAMVGLLEPIIEEKIVGHADVKDTFRVSKVGRIAGSIVADGKVHRNFNVRVVRDGVVVYEGKISSLRRFKEDVREVQSGYECGIGIENFNDVKNGDVLEFYEFEEIAPEL